MTFTQFKQYMEIGREKQLQAIRQEVGSQVGAIASRVDANSNDNAEIKEALKCIETRGEITMRQQNLISRDDRSDSGRSKEGRRKKSGTPLPTSYTKLWASHWMKSIKKK